MKNKILIIIFIVWIALWAGFTARELFVKTNLRDYRALLSRTFEGKRSYVTGDNLYEFLRFCRDKSPKGSTFSLAGIEDGSIEQRRAVYYLYPLIESADPDLVFVYNKPGVEKTGYVPSASLDASRYILKKVK
jgi:hypothetical protein